MSKKAISPMRLELMNRNWVYKRIVIKVPPRHIIILYPTELVIHKGALLFFNLSKYMF